MSKKICLITGGAGFIGCAVSKLLVSEFDEVIAFDNMHPQIHKHVDCRPKEMPQEVRLIRGDVTSDSDWDELLEQVRPDVILHLAAETGTGQSLTEATRHAEVNVVGTTRMLDALVRHKVQPKKIILTSSRAIYGEGKWINSNGVEVYPGQRTDGQLNKGEWDFRDARSLPSCCETTIPMPSNIYASTKLAQENIIATWANSFNVDYTILRLQNVYGPGQSLINSYTGIVSLFVRIAKQGQSIPLYEDGEMLRDFILIDDVAAAIKQVIDMSDVPRKIYDIGSGKATTIGEVAEVISSHYNAPKPHVCGNYRNGDVRHACCDVQRTIADLQWKAQWSLEQGLKRLCDWIDKELQ